MDPVVIMLILLIGCFCCCYCCSSMGAGGYYTYISNIAACFETPPDEGECPVIPPMGEGSLAGFMGLPGKIAQVCITNADDAGWLAGEVNFMSDDGQTKKTSTRGDICGYAKEIQEAAAAAAAAAAETTE